MRVTIPEPCSENWEQMSSTSDTARFCASCQKCVVDFTNLSDKEILHKLNTANGNVCGRFSSFQLDRILVVQTSKPRNYWSAFFSLALTSVMGLNNSFQAKIGLKPKMEILPNAKFGVSENKNESDGRDTILIRGIVIDAESRKPISGATVFIKDVDIHATTLSNGVFEIKIHHRYLGEKTVLVVVHQNSNRTEFSFTKNDLSRPIELKLKYVEHYNYVSYELTNKFFVAMEGFLSKNA